MASDGDRDGLPYVLLEAFASGIPAVSTQVAGIAQLFGAELASQVRQADDLMGLCQTLDATLSAPPRVRNTLARTQRAIVEHGYHDAAVHELASHFGRHNARR